MRSGSPSLVALAIGGALAASCTFPEIGFVPGGSEGPASSTGPSGTGGMGAAGAASSSGGTGVTTSASGNAGAGGVVCESGNDCDCDGDTHQATKCGGDDCADFDNRAYKGATTPYDTQIIGPTDSGKLFDFNCDGAETPIYCSDKCANVTNACPTSACPNGSKSFFVGQQILNCGDMGTLVDCTGQLQCPTAVISRQPCL